MNIHWKDWCWSWSSRTLATWCEELTHWKRPWSWERLKAGGEGNDRGWEGWMASPTQLTWVWVSSRSWWWTGKPGMLQSMGLKRIKQDWATELNWTWQSTFLECTASVIFHWWLCKEFRILICFNKEIDAKTSQRKRACEGRWILTGRGKKSVFLGLVARQRQQLPVSVKSRTNPCDLNLWEPQKGRQGRSQET